MHFVKTKTSDGWYFTGLMSEPEIEKKGIIIHIHGMAGNIYLNPYYQHMHEYYASQGYAFLAGEHRGSGTISEFNTDEGIRLCGNAYETFEDCIVDIQVWVDYAKSLGYTEIWLQAHSLGPSKVVYYYTQTKPKDIKGLIFLSPGDMIGLVHDPVGIKDHEILLPEAKKLVAEGKGAQLLSHTLWGSNIVSAYTYLNFFGENANIAIFNYNNAGLGWKLVNQIDIPVLAITGTKDDAIIPIIETHKAMRILETELKQSPRVKTIVYENAEHGFEGFEQHIVQDVIEFIREYK